MEANMIMDTSNGIHKPIMDLSGSNKRTLGHHIARRLIEIGIKDVFSVPGDSNLVLDYLVAEPELNLIGCCNELNAGYATDGYARCKGVGACVVTFHVGGLSILNAIAGAYSEDLPIICIVGAPNSNDYGSNKILHHTIGLPDFSQELHCFQPITCHQVSSLKQSVLFTIYHSSKLWFAAVIMTTFKDFGFGGASTISF